MASVNPIGIINIIASVQGIVVPLFIIMTWVFHWSCEVLIRGQQLTYQTGCRNLGTQSDVHTHAHDLPPQMGGCWSNGSPEQQAMAHAVDQGAGLAELETSWSTQIEDDGVMSSQRALERVLRHRSALMARNPLGAAFDQPLRAALTYLMSGNLCQPNTDTAYGLRYLRDRISVPRDMPLQSARLLRKALE